MFPLIVSTPTMSAAILTFAVLQGHAQRGPDGQAIFRFDTFGDEQLWTDVLQMQKVISTVSPATALAVGLKVDSDALPPAVINAIKAGQVEPQRTRGYDRMVQTKRRDGGDGK